MIIYFHIDELNRDSIVASALKVKFAKNGDILVYGNRLAARLLIIFHFVFDIIIIPRPHFLYDLWGNSFKKWNTKIIMLSTEALGIICKDYRVMARTLLEKDYFEGNKSIVNEIDAFCLWGERQFNAIAKTSNEILNKFHIVGHPRHDSFCTKSINQSINVKKTIGIVTRSVILNDYYGRQTLDSFSTLLDPHFQFEFYNNKTGDFLKSKRSGAFPAETVAVTALDTACIIKIINKLNLEGFKVIIRPHPREDISVWKKILEKNNTFVSFADPFEPITHWLKKINYLIGSPSTTFYDSIMSGVMPISINLIDNRRSQFVKELWEDNNRLMKYIYQPTSIEELINFVKKNEPYKISTEILNVLKEEANFPECSNSLDRVIEVCKLFDTKNKNQHFSLFLYNISSRIFILLWKIRNLLFGIKQNSSYFPLDKKNINNINNLISTS